MAPTPTPMKLFLCSVGLSACLGWRVPNPFLIQDANGSEAVAASAGTHPGILEVHRELLQRCDRWSFGDLADFFVPPDEHQHQPLVFLTDGFGGEHESWRGSTPMELVKRWALTTGNQTRIGRHQVQQTEEWGYAAIEFERDCPVTTGEVRLGKFRLTSVLRFSAADGWRIAHLHLSNAGHERSGHWDIGVEGPEEPGASVPSREE